MSDGTDAGERLARLLGSPPSAATAEEWHRETTELYDAESRLIRWVDDGAVRVDGVSWQPEQDPLFRDVGEVTRFTDRACDRLGVPRVEVRARKGGRKAHYDPLAMQIAVPPAEVGGAWALRGLVVIHELAHHLVAVGGVQEGGSHGATFRTRMLHALEILGFPVQARLLQVALGAGPAPEQDVWRGRIEAILRQAEATPHRAEAETFMARAQELATRHAIDLALLAARDAAVGGPDGAAERPEEVVVVMGRSGQRWLRNYCRLFMAVARANDVSYLIASNSTRMYAHGMPSDITMTIALHESLRAQMVSSAAAWMATGEWKRERVLQPTRSGTRSVPLHWSTAKTSFYEGFVASVAARLDESRKRAEEVVLAAERARTPSSARSAPLPTAAGAELASTSVVLAAKREQVRAFHDEITAGLRPRHWRAGDYAPLARSAAGNRAGQEAGRRAAVGRRRGELAGAPGPTP